MIMLDKLHMYRSEHKGAHSTIDGACSDDARKD
jgi:hypothetical protein